MCIFSAGCWLRICIIRQSTKKTGQKWPCLGPPGVVRPYWKPTQWNFWSCWDTGSSGNNCIRILKFPKSNKIVWLQFNNYIIYFSIIRHSIISTIGNDAEMGFYNRFFFFLTKLNFQFSIKLIVLNSF